MLKNWLLFLFLPILSIACQPAHAVEVGITKKSCNVAVNLSQKATELYDKNLSQFEIMMQLDMISRKDMDDLEFYAGAVYAKLNLVDIRVNKRKGFTNGAILDRLAENCVEAIGTKFNLE
ncbi:hypothetical protein KEN51_CDS0120 [Pseudomonas phage vB_Pae10145-KEN51]|uniref:Lipoprotein n=2 Tax=Phikzvirus TaxID=680115 RepID=I7DKF1_9CAUD|nr:hypothetical protein [Pseudomonas aeruginosa]YP_009617396.1 hypothetical protein FDI90_gp108 [Pseudomonas phage PA7]YP_009619619.1 hypothetical protein FDJ06_gp079 [Pseudomonas phage SL2]USL86517.1 hypothetical protein CDGHABPJ_00053 [Pseudomonas phage OMKO1]UXD83273.1 hypothetical protein NP274_00221 [Pseudomonas phage Koomba boorn-mokiny kep-wari Wadjak 1]WNV47964.1 hypothetical protein [Pseudomonas phage fMGyn-Pae01]WNV49892.1 hypothetical protein [Pseudomonas phage ANB1]WNV50293.1 hyp